MKKVFLLLAVTGLMGGAVSARSVTKQAMVQHFKTIGDIFEMGYAPYQWKHDFSGWSLNAEMASGVSKIEALDENAGYEYWKVLKSFFDSAKDYHVGYSFTSTESARLPFWIKESEGKVFIAWIDRDKASSDSFPFSVGDEVIEFDGKPVLDVLKKIKNFVGHNVDQTDWSLAQIYLTNRVRRAAFDVPKGPVTIKILKSGASKASEWQMVWEYKKEMVKPSEIEKGIEGPLLSEKISRNMVSPMALELSKEAAPTNPHGIGLKKSYLPSLGKILWRTSEEDLFDAYLYANDEGKLVGYLRIPSYSVEDADKSVAAFAKVLTKFNSTADMLVIDQLNNPGGSVFYLYALASMLAEQPLKAPRHRIMLTRDDVLDSYETLDQLSKVTNDEEAKKVVGETLSGYPVTYQLVEFMRGYFTFTIEQWNAGKKLSDPTWLYAVDHINPSFVVNFTKPVLLLTNELDFSGGDFFPAIMQDNKRVTVMGTRTAGAGGFVNQTSFPNPFGLKGFSYTGSIAERVDLNPIENLGVTPDVEVSFTANDLQNNYVDYIKAVNDQVKAMLNK